MHQTCLEGQRPHCLVRQVWRFGVENKETFQPGDETRDLVLVSILQLTATFLSSADSHPCLVLHRRPSLQLHRHQGHLLNSIYKDP
ncbi:hypothetical protein BG015_007182 [Linnemannia schmuckeri]|uniref:Uncharacterized protein n=1 Tax=Linnemannia schmuckeri TaxID=64567 RepID=A0A9P5VBB5_9FUNG|nr:hypothetical protein BG015_007182 [Linnemannia schmuckeri]